MNSPNARPIRLRNPPPSTKPAPADKVRARRGRSFTFIANRSKSIASGCDVVAEFTVKPLQLQRQLP